MLIVGGGNSAGQAAMYLSRYAQHVQVVVRRESLSDTMSHYLLEKIVQNPKISVLTHTELDRVVGNGRVEGAILRQPDGRTQLEEIDAVFIFIGTRPRTGWLPEEVLRDPRGFVLTGKDLSADARSPRTWKERREPLPLETSAPGVFAAGDIRAGAMNRVASAVGEGAMAVRFVHDYLALT